MIRLHHCPQTRSMRTLWLLEELGVDYEVETYEFGKVLRSEGYARLNPLGRVPALEIDGAVMTETGAIAEYLCESFPQSGMGRLPGDEERRDWLIWIHFAETLSQHVANLTQQHLMLYEDWMRSPTVTKLEAKRIERCYAVIERALADGRAYLLTSEFSAADIGVGQGVYMAQYFVRLDGFPNIQAWYDRLTARPAFQKALPTREELYSGFHPPLEVVKP